MVNAPTHRPTSKTAAAATRSAQTTLGSTRSVFPVTARSPARVALPCAAANVSIPRRTYRTVAAATCPVTLPLAARQLAPTVSAKPCARPVHPTPATVNVSILRRTPTFAAAATSRTNAMLLEAALQHAAAVIVSTAAQTQHIPRASATASTLKQTSTTAAAASRCAWVTQATISSAMAEIATITPR